jgi:hypothetical protein
MFDDATRRWLYGFLVVAFFIMGFVFWNEFPDSMLCFAVATLYAEVLSRE